jgi:Tfp pilus assembly protein PilF
VKDAEVGRTRSKTHRPTIATPQESLPQAEAPASAPAEGWGWGPRATAAALLLVVLVVLAFVPCLGNDFVSWDDEENFLENPSYRGLGWAQLRWDWTSFHIGVYQPLAWMILGVQYLLFTLKPWGYHLFSLILHAINTVVLFVLTVALLARCRPAGEPETPRTVTLSAGLAVALFAVHPLRTEVVAWASCQPYLPCALFFMLSVLAYLHALPEGEAPRWGWLVTSFFLFAAALLSKAVAVTLPAVLLILDVYPLRRLGGGPGRWFGPAVRRVWWEKVPFALLSLLFVILAVFGRAQAEHLASTEMWGIAERIAQACYGIWFYLIKTMLPVNIRADYVLPRRAEMFGLPFVFSILAVLGVSAGLFLLRHRRAGAGLLAAWLSYVVILSPNLGLVRVGSQIAADRYSYVAMIGGVVLLAAGLCRVLHARPGLGPVAVGLTAASLTALSGLTILTRAQCRTWRTSETLWTHVLSHSGSRSEGAHNGLGAILKARGRVDDARVHFEEALRIRPTSVVALNNLGVILKDQGRIGEARARFNEALRLYADYVPTHCNLGLLLLGQGRSNEARAQFDEALRINPNSVDARNSLVSLLYLQGRLDEARAVADEALRINPLSAEAHINQGVLLKDQGQYGEARAQFDEALRINPDSEVAHCNLGLLLLAQGRIEDARAQMEEALRINPNSVLTHNSLALLLFGQGRSEDARAQVDEALRINPESVEAHTNLGVILEAQGRHDEATAQFNEALRINPDSADAHGNLGMLLLGQGRIDDARAQIEEVLRINPHNADAHNKLGLILSRAGRFDEAAARFREAVRINPNYAAAHSNLGLLLMTGGHVEEARVQFEETVRIDPGSVDAHNNLGAFLAQQGRIAEALAQFERALRLNPSNAQVYRNQAMIWATAGEAKYRDGRRAVAAATRACALTEWKNPTFLDTCAAAHAEAGDFDSAVKWQTRALDILTDATRKADFRSRLELYEARKPYRQPIAARSPPE